MGQTTSVQEDKMAKRIRQAMGTFADLGAHIEQANEWAALCPTPKTCQLAFRIVVSDRVTPELLPYVWRIRDNVSIEARKVRRSLELPLGDTSILSSNTDTETIGHAKVLTIRQFYYIYCFLSDVKACAAHTVRFPENSSPRDENDYDETECQICMDKQKQVALPCTHSFCLNCFQHWSAQNKTCPICRSKIDCSEGDELWQLTSNEIEDIGSYATDLVARIYEFLDKREASTFSEADLKRSAERYSAAGVVKRSALSSLVHTDIFPTAMPLSLPSILRGGLRMSTEIDPDVLLALELASGEDQYAAWQYYEQMRRDQVLALTVAMQVEDGADLEPNEG